MGGTLGLSPAANFSRASDISAFLAAVFCMNLKKEINKILWYAGGGANAVTPQESELLIRTDHGSGKSSTRKTIHPFRECSFVKDKNLKM